IMLVLAEVPKLPIGHGSYVAEQWGALGILVVFVALLTGVQWWRSRHNKTYRELRERQKNPPAATDAGHCKAALSRHDRPAGRSVLIGADGRVSTSKTMATLWTAALAYMLIVMGLIAAFTNAQGDNTSPGDILNALISPTSTLYLVLLGGPFAAAVLAKVI